jgi:hypothetical protein
LGEYFLSCHPQCEPVFDVIIGLGWLGELDDGAGDLGGLQQVGYELWLVSADDCAGLFQAEVGLEPVRDDVAVLVPPAGHVGLPGQGQQRSSLLVVGDAVEGEQPCHVGFSEADSSEFHAADFGVGRVDRLGGRCGSDSAGFPEPTQLGAQDDAQRGGPLQSAPGVTVGGIRTRRRRPHHALTDPAGRDYAICRARCTR